MVRLVLHVVKWDNCISNEVETESRPGTSCARLLFHFFGSHAEAVWGCLSLHLFLALECVWKSYQSIFLDSGSTGSTAGMRLDLFMRLWDLAFDKMSSV